MVKDSGFEAPAVHGNAGIAGDRLVGLAFFCVNDGVSLFLNLEHLFDCLEEAVGSEAADPPGDGSVGREGGIEAITDHGMAGTVARTGIAFEKGGEFCESFLAVEVVGVDGSKRSRNCGARAPNGVGGAPWFDPSFRRGKGARKVVERLKRVGDFDLTMEAGADLLAELVFKVFPDEKDNAVEAAADGIEDGVIKEGLAGRTDGLHLFEATEAAAHAGGHDEEGNGLGHDEDGNRMR